MTDQTTPHTGECTDACSHYEVHQTTQRIEDLCVDCVHGESWHVGGNFSMAPDSTKCSVSKCNCEKFDNGSTAQDQTTHKDELDELMLMIDRIDGGNPKHYKQQGEIKAKINELITAKQTEALKKVDRLEVIDDTGRAYVKGSIYGTPVKVQLSYQDDNRTLKVFVEATHTKEDKEEHGDKIHKGA